MVREATNRFPPQSLSFPGLTRKLGIAPDDFKISAWLPEESRREMVYTFEHLIHPFLIAGKTDHTLTDQEISFLHRQFREKWNGITRLTGSLIASCFSQPSDGENLPSLRKKAPGLFRLWSNVVGELSDEERDVIFRNDEWRMNLLSGENGSMIMQNDSNLLVVDFGDNEVTDVIRNKGMTKKDKAISRALEQLDVPPQEIDLMTNVFQAQEGNPKIMLTKQQNENAPVLFHTYLGDDRQIFLQQFGLRYWDNSVLHRIMINPFTHEIMKKLNRKFSDLIWTNDVYNLSSDDIHISDKIIKFKSAWFYLPDESKRTTTGIRSALVW